MHRDGLAPFSARPCVVFHSDFECKLMIYIIGYKQMTSNESDAFRHNLHTIKLSACIIYHSTIWYLCVNNVSTACVWQIVISSRGLHFRFFGIYLSVRFDMGDGAVRIMPINFKYAYIQPCRFSNIRKFKIMPDNSLKPNKACLPQGFE